MDNEKLLELLENGQFIEVIFKDTLHNCYPDLPTLLNGLSKGELGILGYLVFIENNVSAGKLSESLNVTSARIANILNSLEKKNYIVREKSSTDKRKIVVSITDEGIALVHQIRNDLAQKIKYLVSEIGIEEFVTYLKMTKRIKEILNKDGGRVC